MTTRISKLINRRIAELSATHSQKQIAEALGYPKPNIVSMHKLGTAKIPLERLQDYARVLDVDVALLFRLWLEQSCSDPEILRIVSERALTRKERKVLELIREIDDEAMAA